MVECFKKEEEEGEAEKKERKNSSSLCCINLWNLSKEDAGKGCKNIWVLGLAF